MIFEHRKYLTWAWQNMGNHRYLHKLYALNTILPDVKNSTKAILEKAMQGHVIAQSELIGHYQRR